jgi:hypothetical protein
MQNIHCLLHLSSATVTKLQVVCVGNQYLMMLNWFLIELPGLIINFLGRAGIGACPNLKVCCSEG